MTVQRITSIERYIGLSTDTKPANAIVGSVFEETDTLDVYTVYIKIAGVSQWTKLKRNSQADTNSSFHRESRGYGRKFAY